MTEFLTPTNSKENSSFPETICHRILSSGLEYSPSTEYQGRKLYFCTEYCLRAFLDDPERFYSAHSKKRGDPATCEFNKEGSQ